MLVRGPIYVESKWKKLAGASVNSDDIVST